MEYKVKHVGINSSNATQATGVANRISTLFDLEVKDGKNSLFASSDIEVMKAPFKGRCGHIAIGVDSVEDAMLELGDKGVTFDENTMKKDAQGDIIAIYLDEEIGGFAFHLLKNK